LADLAEQEDYCIPLIWSEDYHNSPNYVPRKQMYGVSGMPHAQFQGTLNIIGGGENMLPQYTTIYNQLVDIESPLEIDLIMNLNENNEFELTADVEVTGAVNTDDVNKLLFMLTYNYEYTYSCIVQRYSEEDFNLTEVGQTETFTHTFAGDESWDLSKVRAVAMIQKWNGSTGNYPIHQAAIADFPLHIPEPQVNMDLFINQTEEIDISEYFYYHDQPADGVITVSSSDNESVAAAINGNTLTLECGASVGMSTIELTCVSGVYTLRNTFTVYVLSPETSDIDSALPDSPEQAAYPNNPNEYENSYTDLGWTTQEISTNADLISMNIQCDWRSYDHASEGSFWLTTPSGTSYKLYDATSIQPQELNIDVIDLIGEPVNGNWIFYVEDSYGDGGHQVTNLNVTFTVAGIVSVEDSEHFAATALKGNFPNPFNPVTNIAFSTKEEGRVTLEIYNLKGQKVRTLLNSILPADNHTISWNGRDDSDNTVTSGVYFCKMTTERYTSTKKMLLLK